MPPPRCSIPLPVLRRRGRLSGTEKSGVCCPRRRTAARFGFGSRALLQQGRGQPRHRAWLSGQSPAATPPLSPVSLVPLRTEPPAPRPDTASRPSAEPARRPRYDPGPAAATPRAHAGTARLTPDLAVRSTPGPTPQAAGAAAARPGSPPLPRPPRPAGAPGHGARPRGEPGRSPGPPHGGWRTAAGGAPAGCSRRLWGGAKRAAGSGAVAVATRLCLAAGAEARGGR